MKTYAWKRFTARMIDSVLLCLPFLWVMIQVAEAIQQDSADSLAGSLILSALGTASALIIEPILISKKGTTPGKSLMGLSVLHKDGTLLSHREAFIRTAHVITQGLGLSLRGLIFLTLGYQAIRLWIDKESSWDAKLDSACLPTNEFEFAPVAETFSAREISIPREKAEPAESLIEQEVAAQSVALTLVADEEVYEEEAPVAEENLDDLSIDESELEDPTSIVAIDVNATEDDGLSFDLEEDKAA